MAEERTINNQNHALQKYKARKAIRILTDNLSSISGVQCWAKETGMSAVTLHLILKNVYGKTPASIIREIRYEKLLTLVKEDIDEYSNTMAEKIGLRNSDALRMYLLRYCGTNLTTIKIKVAENNCPMPTSWLTDI